MAAPARPPPRPAAPPARGPYAPPMQPAYRPPPPPLPPEPNPGFHMSSTEALHLGVSIIALTIAFAFAFAYPKSFEVRPPTAAETNLAIQGLGLSFIVVILGFMLHEMAHKVVAQRLHLWAEFRASIGGLAAALGLCIFTPVVFAAPGAVIIVGNATTKDGALISIAGPATNLVIGFAMVPLMGSNPNPPELGLHGNFFQFAAAVNGLLAIFNLLPVPPLDGSKIVRWNLGIYLAMLIGAGLLFYMSAYGGRLF